MAFESDFDLFELHQQLAAHFDLNEIEELCFKLQIDFEEIAGNTKSGKARELVKFCYRNGRLTELVQLCAELRPNETWNRPARFYRQDDLPDEWVEPLQRLYRLVKAFNQNRHLPFNSERTRQGDEIAFTMREAAPFLFGQIDVAQWLRSESTGKRLAAIKYLDWLQDIDYFDNLLGMLVTEKPFVQLHLLQTIYSMLNQLDSKHRREALLALTALKFVTGDPALKCWQERILSELR